MTQTVPLGNLVEIKGGGTPSRTVSEFWNGKIPWATVKDFKSIALDSTEESITPEGVKRSATNIIPSGNVIIPTRMAVGKAAINSVEMAINQDLKALLPKGQIDKRFLLHFLLAKGEFLEGQAQGATVKGIKIDLLKALPFPALRLEEQRRIAAILDKADAIRRKRQQALALADDFLKSVFLEMFGDPATADNYQHLGEHISFVTSGSRGWARFYSKTGSRFIRSLDVQMNHISDEEAVYVTAPNSAEADRCRVEVGDVLLTITGSKIGRVADVRELPVETFISQHVAIIRLRKSLLPEFVSFFLSLSSLGQRQIEQVQYGQAKPGLNLTQIREFRLPVPDMQEQQAFLRILDSTRKAITKLQLELSYSDDLFASLSQRAFRGEL